jgi:uncharacterized protein
VRVLPGADRDGIVGRHGDAWKLRVNARAERGRANEAALRLLAETLELPRRDVRLVSGQTTREKLVELHGIGSAEAERRLAQAVDQLDPTRTGP